MSLTDREAPVLALVGPTASGKSAAALALARAWRSRAPVEIISMDSALVYRDMDIGTAKPSVAERAEVPHHLIDIRDPAQPYSAADFVRDAWQCVRDIQSRGALPLIVGGTMMYLNALRRGLDDMPGADASIREDINAQAAQHGWAAMHQALSQVDPVTAQRLAPLDAQRIQRALEVWRLTGRPLSSFHLQAQGAAKLMPLHIVSLEPHQRSELHQRIADRFQAMVALGFLEEVRQLRARPDLHAELPSMRCVGYRQAWEALDELESADVSNPAGARGDPDPAWQMRGIAATRQLAKRQLTWLRSMPDRRVVACDAPTAQEQVLHQADLTWRRLPA